MNRRRTTRHGAKALLAPIAMLAVLIPSAGVVGASASTTASSRGEAGATTAPSHPVQLTSSDQTSDVAGILQTKPYLCVDSWVLNTPANPAAWGDRSIDVGGTLYPAGSPPATDQGLAQVLVLQRQSGALVSNTSADSEFGFVGLLDSVPPNDIAIVTVAHMDLLFPPLTDPSARFASEVGKLGLLAPPANTKPQWFSGVGWPGLAAGQGWSAFGAGVPSLPSTSTTVEHPHCGTGNTVSLAGNLGGALIPDQSGVHYSFVTTDAGTFSSRGGTGSITYAGRTSGPDPSAKGTGGFHAVVIDRQTGQALLDNTFSSDTGASVSRFAQYLTNVSQNQQMVIVSTYGRPLLDWTKAPDPQQLGAQLSALHELVDAIQALGGSSTAIEAVALNRDPNHGGYIDYSFVGAGQIPPAAGIAPFDAIESSPALGGLDDGTVAGQFTKDHTGQLVPTLAGSNLTNTAIPDLTSVALGPPVAFPAPDAAFKWISEKVTASGTYGTPTTDVRTLYPALTAGKASDLKTAVNGLAYPGAAAGFSEEAFKAAQTTAAKELGDLGTVESYLKEVRVTLDEAATQVDKDSNPLTDVTTGTGDSGLTGTPIGVFVASLTGGLPYEAAQFFPPASAARAFALIELLNVGTTIGNFTGYAQRPADPRQVIETTGGQLREVLSGELRNSASAVNVLQDVIIGDPAKLDQMAHHINATWALSPTDRTNIEKSIRLSFQAFATESLLEKTPAPFQVGTWRVTGSESKIGQLLQHGTGGLFCDAGGFYDLNFADLPFARWTLLLSTNNEVQLGVISIPSSKHNSNQSDSDAIASALGHLFNSGDVAPGGARLAVIPTLSQMAQVSGTNQPVECKK